MDGGGRSWKWINTPTADMYWITTYPSAHIIATVISRVGKTVFHATGISDVSMSQGFCSSKALWNSSRSSIEQLASGPTTPRIVSWPEAATLSPVTGFRSEEGRKPYAPQNAAGQRIDPPISVPIPSGAHRKPIEAPSPPEDPPGVRVRLSGFNVVPVILLVQHRC